MFTDEINAVLRSCGVEIFGFCAFSYFADRLLPCRAASRLPENSASVIIAAFPYKVNEKSPENISRYSAVADYHKVCGEILSNSCKNLRAIFIGHSFEPFCDNSPIREIEAAARAGIGVIGENGLLITKKYGSFVFLGEIVTDLNLPSGGEAGRCIGCGKCKEVCPMGVVGESKESCLSAVTQKKSEPDDFQKQIMKEYNAVWGCDICQEKCPMNKNVSLTNIKEFSDSYRDFFDPSEDISGRAYEWRGKAVPLRNHSIINE